MRLRWSPALQRVLCWSQRVQDCFGSGFPVWARCQLTLHASLYPLGSCACLAAPLQDTAVVLCASCRATGCTAPRFWGCACFSVTVAAVWIPYTVSLCVRVAVALLAARHLVCFRLHGNLTAVLRLAVMCTRPVLCRAACWRVSYVCKGCCSGSLQAPPHVAQFESCGCCALLGRDVPRLFPVCWHPAAPCHWVLVLGGSLWGVVMVLPE